MGEITDHRKQKTRIAIKEAFVALMQKKDPESITITEVTAYADIRRTTFYKIYSDISEVYCEVKEELIQEFTDLLTEDTDTASGEVYRMIMDFVIDHPPVCRILFCKNGTELNKRLLSKLSERLLDTCLEAWKEEFDTDDLPSKREYLARYRIQGTIALLRYWEEDGYSIPAADLKNWIGNLDKTMDERVFNEFEKELESV